MVEYDRIDLDEGIDVNKTSNSRECWLCHYWYVLDKNFNYQKYYCDGCHDISMKTISINVSKDDAMNIMHNSNLIDKKGVL